MRNTTRSIVVALAGVLLAGGLAARQDPKVSAQLSTGVVRLGEKVGITIVLENSREARIVEVPSVPGLEIGKPSAPGVYEFRNYLNGRLQRGVQLTWHVALRASDVGEYVVPAFILEVEGQRLSTQPLTLKVVRDIRGEDLGYFEVRTGAAKVVEGQPFTLELRFGWESTQRYNYGNLSLPWWGALPGAIEVESAEPVRNAQPFTINDRLEIQAQELEPTAGRRNFLVTKTYLPVRSGKLEFPTSFFEFGRYGTSRGGGFFSRSKKTESHFVRAEPFMLEVVELPTEGQPFDFSGAVGTLDVRAMADTRDVVVGDSIKLTVDWLGAGNLEFFEAPDLGLIDDFSGFRVYGATEEKRIDRRRVVYDLAPLTDEVVAIPPVPLTVFDPGRGVYDTIKSVPIPIRVRPLARAISLGDEADQRFDRDILDIDTRALGSEPAAGIVPTDRWVVAALFGLPLLWFGVRTEVRRRRGDPGAPLERRRRRARKRLARASAGEVGPAALLAAFDGFLAARSRDPEEAWMGRKLAGSEAALTRDATPADLEAADVLRERLDRAVYGAGEAVSTREVLAMAERLMKGGL